MKYSKLYEFGCLQLKAADISDWKTDARLLLEFACGTDFNFLYINPDFEVSEDKETLYKEYIDKRLTHVPVQHITGTQCFMGLDFKVTPDVLVPRPDTEILVEEVLKDLHDGMKILDMCTGSGCILLSLLKYSNDCTGQGVDISPEALKVARENAENLGITSAEFIESDLFQNVSGKFDILVSNPPYIKTSEIKTLMPEVRVHDPYIALDGHDDGVYFYRKILEDSPEFLNRGSLIAFEIGNDEGEAVFKLMEEAGLKNIEVIKDYGGNDRVVKGFLFKE
jgi:release factor glutamine methyltransferase